VTIAVLIVIGTCSLREPGGPGLSPLAAGLAIAGIALVVRYLGLGWLGCFGTLLVLAAAAQVSLSGARRPKAIRHLRSGRAVLPHPRRPDAPPQASVREPFAVAAEVARAYRDRPQGVTTIRSVA
jgi:hypothetical protein